MSGPFDDLGDDGRAPDTPEDLFYELQRGDEVKKLWSQQADVLRDYHSEYREADDVAFELPTGSGKTLTALLIAEWRRLANRQRVAYLCPTRQLANQATSKAEEYGLDVSLLIGRSKDHPPEEVTAYTRGDKVAITTYATIFNINPQISEPDTLVLDDAHVAETYVGGNWSLQVDRNVDENIFDALVDVLSDELPQKFLERVQREDVPMRESSFEHLPLPSMWEQLKEIRGVLDARYQDANSDNLPYRWRTLRDNLHACMIYLTPWRILIRPLVPPTFSHGHFAGADQRIYMSATLGAEGDLERMTGVSDIERIPTPSQYSDRSEGRRFFLFPGASLGHEESTDWALSVVSRQHRALVICRDHRQREDWREKLNDHGFTCFDAGDVEDSVEPFVKSEDSALVVASRFDGIDLPGDACRLVIIPGNPNAVNLQERFFLSRLGIDEVLKDRVALRFTQAVGRCTRSDNDYALVLPLNQDLLQFCAQRENREHLPPEVAAEVDVGLDASEVEDTGELDERVSAFYERGAGWETADSEIRERRKQIAAMRDERGEVPYASTEVEFTRFLWNGDQEAAAEKAKQISDNLTEEKFRTYRAWWSYVTGSLYLQLYREQGDEQLREMARKYLQRAKQASESGSWFVSLTSLVDEGDDGPETETTDERTRLMVEGIQTVLRDSGLHSPRLEKELRNTRNLLESGDHRKFDEGVERLGEWMGWDSERTTEDGDPDVVWQLKDIVALAFETKPEESPDHGISKATCRQAQGHYEWLDDQRSVDNSVVVVVSPRDKLHHLAEPHTGDLSYLHPDDVLGLFRRVAKLHRQLNSKVAEPEAESARDTIRESMSRQRLTADDVMDVLIGRSMDSLPREDS